MIAIIEGKRYNTETATEIGAEQYGYASGFHHFRETLYRTKKGRWFLHGIGGPLSHWAVSIDNQGGRSGGSGIQPLDDDEARAWLERYEYVVALEKYFNDSIEDA